MLPTRQNGPTLIQRVARRALQLKIIDKSIEKKVVYFLGLAVLVKYFLKLFWPSPLMINVLSIAIEVTHITAVVMLILFIVRVLFKRSRESNIKELD